METGLRVILLLVAVTIIAGIVWDTLRSRRKPAMKKTRVPRVDRLDGNMNPFKKEKNIKDLRHSGPIGSQESDSSSLYSDEYSDKYSSEKYSNEYSDEYSNEYSDERLYAEDLADKNKSPLNRHDQNSYRDRDPHHHRDAYHNRDSHLDLLEDDEVVLVKAKKTPANVTDSINKMTDSILLSSPNVSATVHSAAYSIAGAGHTSNMAHTTKDIELQRHKTPATDTEIVDPNKIFILNVMAKQPGALLGKKLIRVFDEVHLFYGEMQIFHRYENADGSGRHMFSLASAVEPGFFDIASLESFVSPGLTLFFSPTTRNQSIAAFELMLRTAKILAAALDGEIKDHNRRPLTLESIEKYRASVRESVKLHRASSSSSSHSSKG